MSRLSALALSKYQKCYVFAGIYDVTNHSLVNRKTLVQLERQPKIARSSDSLAIINNPSINNPIVNNNQDGTAIGTDERNIASDTDVGSASSRHSYCEVLQLSSGSEAQSDEVEDLNTLEQSISSEYLSLCVCYEYVTSMFLGARRCHQIFFRYIQ